VSVAYLSWRFIEQPFRTKVVVRERRHVFALGANMAASLVVVAAAVLYGGGLKERFSPQVQKLAAFEYDPRRAMRWGSYFISQDRSKTSHFDEEKCLAISGDKKNVLIIGDSYAAHLWSGLTATYPDVHFLQATGAGCATDFGTRGKEHCRQVMHFVFEEFLPGKTLDAIIVAKSWSGDEIPLIVGPIEKLKEHAPEVYVFGPLVQYISSLPRLLALSAVRSDAGLVVRARKEKNFQIDMAFKEFFRGKGVRYVSLIDALCRQHHCLTTDEQGRPLQHDRGHLTADGSAFLARTLADQLEFTH
jgi:hypothetical protein